MSKKVTAKKYCKNNRIEWIDMAKGLAMICIILGHSIPDSVRWVFTFHVPIFLIISGYFLPTKGDFKEFVIKKFRGLIVPYIFTCVVLMVIGICKDIYAGLGLGEIAYNARILSYSCIYASGSSNNMTLFGIQSIGAIWFLIALFWALMLVRVCIDKKYGFVVIAIIAIISYVSAKYVWLPFDLQSGGTAAVFVYVGAYLKRKGYEFSINKWLLILGIFVYGIEVAFDINLSVVRNFYKYTILSVIGAILISYVVCCMCYKLESIDIINKMLTFFGRYSIVALCFHLIELNTIPWNSIVNLTIANAMPFTKDLCVFIIRLLFATICILFVTKVKTLRKIFGV